MIEIKLYIISAGGAKAAKLKEEKSDYLLKFDEGYAQRFIAHLKNNDRLCTACGEDCIKCRVKLVPDFSESIVGHLRLPHLTNQFIENPEDFLPEEFPEHDITIAINIHSDLLLELPPLIQKAGSKALIVPVESPDWLGGWTKNRLEEECSRLGLEFVAPKPFCSLEADQNTYIGKFVKNFRVGRPVLDLFIEDRKIKKVKVVQSAPCGATYYLARIFKGQDAGEEILQLACKGLSSYPCTASTKIDPEFKDSITHKANYLMMDILADCLQGK